MDLMLRKYLVLAFEGAGRSEDNSVDVRDLSADEVVGSVTASVAVVGRKRSLLPKTGGLAGLVVDGEVCVGSLILGLDGHDAVLRVSVVASNHLAGEGGELGDGALDWLLGLVSGELEADGLDGAVVLAQRETGDVDVLVDGRAGLAAVGWVGALRGLGSRSGKRNSEEGGGGDELHDECMYVEELEFGLLVLLLE